MSKTLFNTNTFQSKTLQNSNTIDIGDSNVTNFTATNATITNLTNTELQAATSGVATNATAINSKQDEITASDRLSATLIGANGNVSNTEFGYLSTVTSNIQTQINDKQDEITSSDRLSATLIGANGNVSNAEFGYLSDVTSNIQTQINDKQDEITSSDRLSATLIGANGNVSNAEFGYLSDVTSNIQTQINDKQDEITSSDRLSATLIGDNGNVSNAEFGYLSTVSSNIQTQIDNKQATITPAGRLSATLIGDNGNVSNQEFGYLSTVTSNIQTQISTNLTGINNIGGRLTTIEPNIEGITASSNITTIDNQVIISRQTNPQLSIIQPTGGNDVTIELRGKRTGSTTSRHAKIDLQNSDSGVTPSVRNMVSIVGRVTNHTSNIGGLEIVNYTDGQTATSALTMSPSGNFNIGAGTVFQDVYKMSINGTLNVSSSIYQIPQMTSYNFDKDVVSTNFWGNGNRQTDLDSTRTVGTAFSSHSDGRITITQTGTYKIRVSGNLQSRYNDRLAFVIYLVSLNSTNDVTADYFENSNYNFFSWLYSRNTSDGAHGNVSFEDHIYITSGNKIEIRNKLDINGVDFNDVLAESVLSLYLNMTITKITDQDINSP